MSRDVRARGYGHMLAVIRVVYMLIIVLTSPAARGPRRVATLGYLRYEAVRTRRFGGKQIGFATAFDAACLVARQSIGIVGSVAPIDCGSRRMSR